VGDAAPPRLPAALATLLTGAEHTFPVPMRSVLRAGVLRTADYQDIAYARSYLDRLVPFVAVEQKQGDGSCRLPEEVARQLALAMAYEDTIRVAELKIRPSRFARVRQEVKLGDGQLLEIAEFMHPRTQEIADTLPAPLGRWLLRTGWARRAVDRLTAGGRTVRTTSLGGFLLLYALAALKPQRPRSLRFGIEQRDIDAWLATVLQTAGTSYDLAVEVAACRALVKGYGDTHARGRARFDRLMGLVPALAARVDAAVGLARLRKAANADESGEALETAIAEARLSYRASAAVRDPAPRTKSSTPIPPDPGSRIFR
jgi:indolepyruvate ferredoxin oxidoreductase beta subunit